MRSKKKKPKKAFNAFSCVDISSTFMRDIKKSSFGNKGLFTIINNYSTFIYNLLKMKQTKDKICCEYA
ncbi:hypothetical protein LCGC14_2541940, partial [marine sediment metagenome]